MSLQPPPIQSPVVDSTGKPTLPWVLYFNQLFTGDGGNNWTPTFQSLTNGGAATIVGRYYKLSNALAFFAITVTGGTTTATAGTTYCDNFPLAPAFDGACLAVSGNLGSAAGMINASNNRIYVPTWTAVTVPVTVVGIIEITNV